MPKQLKEPQPCDRLTTCEDLYAITADWQAWIPVCQTSTRSQPNVGTPNLAVADKTKRRVGNLEVQISAKAIVKTEITEEAKSLTKN